jgi:hypothetical protein
VFTCQAAHSDNIKQVGFLPGRADKVISVGLDKEVKLWHIDLSQTENMMGKGWQRENQTKLPYSLLSQCKLTEGGEAFTFIRYS